MAASSSLKLLNTIEWSKRLNFNRRSALGNFMEPALTSANTVLQTVVGAPFAWRWNRVVTGFIATAGQQDYTLISWNTVTPVKLGWLLVDANGNSQSVTTAGTTGSVIPTFSNTKGAPTFDGSAVWTNIGSIGASVSSTYSLAWIETSSVMDLNNTKWYEMESKICLGQDSSPARPRNVAAQGDDGLGNITFRLMPVPDQAYPVTLTLQKRPPLFTGVNQSWAPIPDEYSHIYNWGFLALMWLFSDDPRFSVANQKFVTQLLGANQGLTQTQINIFLSRWQEVTGQPMSNQVAMQQGYQSRAT